MPTLDTLLRQQISTLLKTGNAHMPFEEAVADFPEDKINTRPPHVDYTFWHLIEHLRLSQRDMLDYLTGADYQEMEWPADYWPAADAVTDKVGWSESVAGFLADRDALAALAKDPAIELTTAAPGNPEHTVLRGLLIIADHNAYHTGELAILRQVDSAWGKR